MNLSKAFVIVRRDNHTDDITENDLTHNEEIVYDTLNLVVIFLTFIAMLYYIFQTRRYIQA